MARCFGLVPEARRALHAGVSHWRGHSGLNGRSIGIEIVNPGHEWGYRDFPALQMAAVCDLCLDILAATRSRRQRRRAQRRGAGPQGGPGRDVRLGRLAENGVGLWPHGVAGDDAALPADAMAARGCSPPSAIGTDLPLDVAAAPPSSGTGGRSGWMAWPMPATLARLAVASRRCIGGVTARIRDAAGR